MNLRILVIFCFQFQQAISQQVQELPLSTHLNAYHISDENALDVLINPAIAQHQDRAIVTVYGSRLYQLQSLQIITAAVLIPLKPMHLAGTVHFFGGEGYNKTNFTFTCARSLGKGTSLGLNMGYEKTFTKGYAGYTGISAAIGSIIRINELLNTGIRWKMQYAGEVHQFLPDYAAGFSYKLSDELVLAAELSKAVGSAASLSTGIYFEIKKGMAAQLAFSSGNGSLFLELEISLKAVQLAFSTSFHQPLGQTPGLLFSYIPAKAK